MIKMFCFKHSYIIYILLFSSLTLAANPEAISGNKLQSLIQAVNSDPNNPNAHFNLGLFYFQTGKFSKSSMALQQVVRLNPTDNDAWILLGTANLKAGQYKEAEVAFLKTLQMNPQNIDAQNNLGLVYYLQQKYENAIENFQATLQLDPENLVALNNLASCFNKLGRLADAINEYKRILKIDPQSQPTYDRLALLYFDAQKYDDIIRLYFDSQGKIPESSSMLTHVGFAYLYKQEYKKAYQSFESAKQVNPGDPENYYGLGLIAYRNAELDIAIQDFKRAISLRKDYTEALQQLAMSYEDKGEYIKALFYYRQIMKMLPDNRSARNNYRSARSKAVDYFLRKGSQAYFEGDFKEALDDWQKVIKLDPKNENAKKFISTARQKLAENVKDHNSRATAFYEKNMHQDAYREWRAALQLEPGDNRAQQGLKKVKLKQQEMDEIITAQAMDQVKKGNVKAALKDLHSTLQASPKNVVAQSYVSKLQNQQKSGTEQNYRKGIELFSKGQYRKAITHLEQALELDPKDQQIKNLLYKARTKLRENIKALSDRGNELASAGRIAEAKEKFNEVLTLDPTNTEANESLTKMTGKVASTTVSKDEIKKLYYEGVSLYLDGQNRRAIEVWQKILALDPENQEAKSSIVKAEMELKEMEKRGIKSE